VNRALRFTLLAVIRSQAYDRSQVAEVVELKAVVGS
jgi:hypothetical protein